MFSIVSAPDVSLKFFNNNIKPTEKQIQDMKKAETFFRDEKGMGIDTFLHGVSKNGTIGGIATGNENSGFKKLAYCLMPDGTTIMSIYAPDNAFCCPGDSRVEEIASLKKTSKGNQFISHIYKEFRGEDLKTNIPTSIKKVYNLPNHGEVYIIKSKDSDGNKVRTVKYPSGHIYKKVTSPSGDVLEHNRVN